MIFFHVRPGIISGVYEIRNRISNKSYIGSASDIRARWSNHARLLKKTTHPNLHLQESFKKHFDALEDTASWNSTSSNKCRVQQKNKD